MLTEFKAFVMRGNVMDLAIAVIIGAAFGKIVASLTDDLLMPIIGTILGGLDFSSHFIILNQDKVPPALAGSTDYAALKKAGVPLLGWGEFVTQAVNFLIAAFVIFLLIKAVNRVMPKPPEDVAGDPADIVLLREIRDSLRA
ncbi:large conductance mechanosensitive channel protein MscL [uncultured Sphingomonas sp.]|uniref:large conductance mechanosensitive channel protein MscL n=1 Tax=uncultured Sphingomonas sp. TaxID=158754 RepID=UPI0035CC666E